MTAVSVIIAIIACVFLWGVQRPKDVVLLALFLSPWQGLDVDVGVRVTALQSVLLAAIFSVMTHALLRPGVSRGLALNPLIIAYVFWTVIISLVYLPILPDASVEGGVFRSPMVRAAIQIPVFLLSLSPIVLVPVVLRTWKDVRDAGKAYVISCVILSVIGWIQLGIWVNTGTNPLPIGLLNTFVGGVPGTEYEGLALIGEEQIYRMNSFGNEPKFLGVALVVGMFLLQQRFILGGQTERRWVFVWGLLSISVFATLSTSAIYLWVVGTVLQVGLADVVRKLGRLQLRPRKYFSAITVVGIVATITFLSVFDPSQDDGAISLTGLLYARTLGRAEYSTVIIEDFDEAILAFLVDSPINMILGVGLGNIHLFANEYLSPDVAEYARGTSFTGKAGYLRVITESGLIGLTLFLVGVLGMVSAVLRKLRGKIELDGTAFEATTVAMLAVVGAIGYLATSLIGPQAVFTIGVCVATGRILLARSRIVSLDTLRRSSTEIRALTYQARH